MAGPKRQLLPLLLLSLSALFFYSYYHSSLTLHADSNSNPNFNFNLRSQIPSHRPNFNFTFILKVLAFNRHDSLARCLRSLAAADYLSDRVHLHVYIDHFDHGGNGSATNEDQKLDESHRMLDLVDGFDWKFGEKLVHYRTRNVGLQAQWLEAWWPSSDHEFAFVVEDDLEVSPLYYKFLRSLIVNYYYNASNYRPYIYGASLQRPRFVPGKHGNKIQLENETRIFLYQLVGTWGQLLFPKPWKEFRLWYDIHKAMEIKPFLEGMVTTGWYKKLGERIWTPWFIKFIHSRGYFNFYTSFSHERALSLSHRDAGVNYGKTAGPDSHLLDENSLDYGSLEMQPLGNLKWYDFCFREVLPERVVRSFDELGPVLKTVQKQETVIFVSLYEVLEMVTKNLLCNFERLNIGNFILIGTESEILFDLARRGHPVIVEDHFLRSLRTYKADQQDLNAKLTNRILVKAHVVKKCLEYGYNCWVVDGNMLPAGSYPYFKSDPIYDYFTGKSSELFFAKSSFSAKKIWIDSLISKVAAMVDSLLSQKKSASFVHIMAKLLEQKGVMIKSIDDTIVDVNIGSDKVKQSSLGGEKNIVFWSSEMGFDLIQKRLEELGMWMLDKDLSCKAVVCHQS